MSLADEFEAAIAGIQGLNPCFNAPLDEGVLHEIETKTGFQLPEEFKNLYRLHNGQEDCCDSLFDFFNLNPARDILRTWDALKTVEPQCEEDGIKADPDEGIKDKWCSSKWLPFANTADGHSICIDYDPDEGGKVGQIVVFWYNDEERPLIADSFADFLKSYLEKLKEGEYIFDLEISAIVRKDGEPMFGY